MRHLAILAALLLTPVAAHATASTTTYSASTGRWIATCPSVAGVAECTLDCTHSPVALSCSDTDTCAFTLAETHSYFDPLVGRTATAFVENDTCEVVNRGSNNVTFATSSGVQELDAPVTLAQYGARRFTYSNARWTGKGAAATQRPGHWAFQICGNATTVNNNTIYYGPTQAITSSATVGRRTCDTTAAGSATEATADEPALTGKAFAVTALTCTSADPGVASGLTYTLRSAAAAVSPATACTIANGAAGSCVANIQTTTDVASGATVAIAVSSLGDIGSVPFICDVDVVF